MTPAYVAEDLRERVRQADRLRCAYCGTSEQISGIPLTIDHILPTSKGGPTCFENLCLACWSCNEFKTNRTEAEDPITGENVPLFHPRKQQWSDHFRWSMDGTRVEGLTQAGRATVIVLRMNREAIVSARRRWVMVGWHPPEE
jgi:hypothetical protein